MAKIFIYDEFSPEDTAMMQALYSRSPQSVVEHVEKVKQTGSGKFMETFYVGYGHASIADCGSTTIFIEQISMLADKAIQDWPLYSGQETSTRYCDMAKQPIIDPVKTKESKTILDNWMKFYIEGLSQMEEFLIAKYPKKETEDEKIYRKAIKARAFDIMRGFLPAGITTQLSWHTNLRQAYDKLCFLRHHSLIEVREIAETILAKLQEKYRHSFCQPVVSEQEEYRKKINDQYYYFKNRKPVDFSLKTKLSRQDLAEYKNILKRPQKTGLPHFLTELGAVTFDFLLDFGSFRDLQRHRNGVCRMPLLTTKIGFNSWYLDELSDSLNKQAKKLIVDQKKAISKLKTDNETKQYYIAMGFNVACRVTYGIPAAAYVIELRSGKQVHPTLRRIALLMRKAMLKKFPELPLNCDLEPAVWDISRGLQDIVKK